MRAVWGFRLLDKSYTGKLNEKVKAKDDKSSKEIFWVENENTWVEGASENAPFIKENLNINFI